MTKNAWMRTALERLARGRRLRRRLPAPFDHRPLYVSPDAALAYLRPGPSAFDPQLLAVAAEHVHEDSVVWDVGANVGVFALAAASRARRGSTLAIEADPWLAHLIRDSLRLPENRDLPARVLSCAVSERDGTATFRIARRGRASNSLVSAGGRSQAGGAREEVLVPTLKLDTLLESGPDPTLVKIDVEGAEALVLRGAARLLSEVRPLLYVEVGQPQAAEVTRLLCEQGYDLFDGSRPLADQAPAPTCAFNTLARPRAAG